MPKPKFHYADFHEVAGLADTHKPSRHVEIVATKYLTNPFVAL